MKTTEVTPNPFDKLMDEQEVRIQALIEDVYDRDLKLIEASATIKRLEASISRLIPGLCTALDEFEVKFDNSEECDSVEIAQWYVTYASLLIDQRKANRIKDVQNWINNYKPW